MKQCSIDILLHTYIRPFIDYKATVPFERTTHYDSYKRNGESFGARLAYLTAGLHVDHQHAFKRTYRENAAKICDEDRPQQETTPTKDLHDELKDKRKHENRKQVEELPPTGVDTAPEDPDKGLVSINANIRTKNSNSRNLQY